MRVICVDDEELIMNLTVSLCSQIPQISDARGFVRAEEALEWLQHNHADIAILDINMPGMDGIEMARNIREMQPGMAIIFLTGYAEYALDAFSVHASGYLCKPITLESLQAEVEYAISNMVKDKCRIRVKTFGEFDVFVSGRLISFERSRAKSLMAFLVDRRGGSITRAEAFAVLWEKGVYDRSMQKQLDVVVRSLRNTLEQNNIGEIFELNRGSMRIVPEYFECDLYRFLQGDQDAISSYQGEYMNSYSWASQTEAYLDELKKKQDLPS